MIKPGQKLILIDGREVDAETVLRSEAVSFAISLMFSHLLDSTQIESAKAICEAGDVQSIAELLLSCYESYAETVNGEPLYDYEYELDDDGVAVIHAEEEEK